MLRSSLSLLLATAAALAVAGCPVYDDDCVDDSGCGPGYVCHVPSRECVTADEPSGQPDRCANPNDCDTGETCDRFGRCSRQACGAVGCVSGYRCALENGIEHCVRTTGGGGAGGAAGESGAGNEAGALDQGGTGG
jgi:hypothetical protein